MKLTLDAVDSYQYVSFDIYDTLLYRSVSTPEEVFDIVAKYIFVEDEKLRREYRSIRIKADNDAREKKQGEEVNIDEIFEEIALDPDTKKSLREKEIELERSILLPNRVMIDFLHECRNLNKKIVITSDMYLPECVICDILKNFNIEYDHLFLSNSYGVTKRSGKLFDVLLETIGIDASQLVHIGDDTNNDIAVPSGKGITCYERFFEPDTRGLSYINDLKKTKLGIALAQMLRGASCLNPEQRIGYYVLGPFLKSFCEWLKSQKVKYSIDTMAFVAREGYLIEKCYKALYPNDKTAYIRLNKNLLRLPLVDESNFVSRFLDSIPDFDSFTWGQILKYFGISYNNLYRGSEVNGFTNIDLNKHVKKDDILNGKFENEMSFVRAQLSDKCQVQRMFLKEYIEQEQLTNCRIGLVNNSINGNGQYLTQQFCNEQGINIDMLGLQFIKSNACRKKLGARAKAWISDNLQLGIYTEFFHRNCLLLEHLMFEPSGTALYFEKSQDRIVVVCEDQRLEKLNNNTIARIQSWALKFIEDFKGLSISNQGLKPMVAFLSDPSVEDAEMLCSIYNDDIEGDRKLCITELPLTEDLFTLKKYNYGIDWLEGFLKLKSLPEERFNEFKKFQKSYYRKRYIKSIIIRLLHL